MGPFAEHVRLQSLIDKLTGGEDQNWSRVVMRRECRRLIEDLQPGKLKALEISGSFFGGAGFKEYKTVFHPEYDVCATLLPETFDLIIAEQVFEHLLWPYRACQNVYRMLNAGGHFLISTPFLVKVHNIPDDCTRWTETGLKYFLAECGFPLERIRTGSWGNTACIKAHFKGGDPVRYRRRIHSLHNEPDYPYHVWALAQK